MNLLRQIEVAVANGKTTFFGAPTHPFIWNNAQVKDLGTLRKW